MIERETGEGITWYAIKMPPAIAKFQGAYHNVTQPALIFKMDMKMHTCQVDFITLPQ